jgi:hypothetical protein
MSNKPRKKSAITLELTKEIFTGDSVHIFVQGRKIAISGMIAERILQSLLAGHTQNGCLILWEVSDQQIANLKEQLDEIVKPNNIKETGKILFTDVKDSTIYKRLEGVIIFRNTIFRVSKISIYIKENGSYSVIFGIV